MADDDVVLQIRDRAMDAWSAGNAQRAFELIDSALAAADTAGRPDLVGAVGRTGMVIGDSSRDWSKVQAYGQVVLGVHGQDAYVHFHLAKASSMLGDRRMAGQHRQLAQQLAKQAKDERLLRMLEQPGE